MDAFAWLGEVFQALLSFVPRRVIVRSTHGGVKWRMLRGPKELKPGVRWYWPLISEIEIIPVARQTLNLQPQALVTKEGKEVVVGGVVVYSISDVVMAIGERNFDVDTTVNDISQCAIVEVITTVEFKELLNNLKKIENELTKTCKRQLKHFGVLIHRVALTDFSPCRSLNIMGIYPSQVLSP
jgi:regulator of protease activity HflC (stomatin/prohibitin superfamily)